MTRIATTYDELDKMMKELDNTKTGAYRNSYATEVSTSAYGNYS